MQSQYSSLRRLSIPHGAGNRNCGVNGRPPTLLRRRHQVDRALKLIIDGRLDHAASKRKQNLVRGQKRSSRRNYAPSPLPPTPAHRLQQEATKLCRNAGARRGAVTTKKESVLRYSVGTAIRDRFLFYMLTGGQETHS